MNCKLTADKTAAEAGETITLTAVCDEGYTLAAENIQIASRSGAIVATATDDPGKFTFVMPENDTYIKATAQAVQPPQPGPAEVSTVITEGADGTRKIGSGTAYVIKATCADTSLFQNINVDGVAIDKSYYDVTADGSVLTITIHSDYLDTLAKGKHTIELAFAKATMNASTTLTVTGTTVPKTGDAENLAMYITVMLAAAGIIAAVIINRKRSVNK